MFYNSNVRYTCICVSFSGLVFYLLIDLFSCSYQSVNIFAFFRSMFIICISKRFPSSDYLEIAIAGIVIVFIVVGFFFFVVVVVVFTFCGRLGPFGADI